MLAGVCPLLSGRFALTSGTQFQRGSRHGATTLPPPSASVRKRRGIHIALMIHVSGGSLRTVRGEARMTVTALPQQKTGRESHRDGGEGAERLSPTDQWRILIEEGRMILPGIQALFGFQLIAIFNQSFGAKLTTTDQWLHLIAMSLTATAAALAITPAALHRQTDPDAVSHRLVAIATPLQAASLAALSTSVLLDVYLVANVVTGSQSWAVVFAGALWAVYVGLWFVLPRLPGVRKAA
jgi:Family of unknown function (DUF6328)